jgi:asparagine synthase (glutamine-hydrolysing)
VNLFVVAWNAPPAGAARLGACLERMRAVYPTLEPATLARFGEGACVAASIRAPDTPAPMVATDRAIYLVDGLPVDRLARFSGDAAEDLRAHWSELPERLEGQFVLARVSPRRLEVLTDPLGLGQMYYRQLGSCWVLSNSVAVVEHVTSPTSWDPDGMRIFLGLGWVDGDYTLRQGIRAMPGGARWTWDVAAAEPTRTTYFSPADVAGQRPLIRAGLRRRVSELTVMCSGLSRFAGPVHSQLTGGLDSRAVASLLIRARVPASYRTSRVPDSRDADVAAAIARRFGLAHEVDVISDEGLLETWGAAARRLVTQNDGLVSLWQVADFAARPPEPRRVVVSGHGGEIGRAPWSPVEFLLSTAPEKHLDALLAERLRGPDALLSADVHERSVAHLREFVRSMLDHGIAPMDVPDAFYAWGRVRRWGGANLRKSRPNGGEPFAPLCTRPYIRAAFALSALRRHAEVLPHAIIRLGPAGLPAIPFADQPWKRHRTAATRFFTASRWHEAAFRRLPWRVRRRFRWTDEQPTSGAPANQVRWLESRRESLRSLCLDQPASDLWQVVSRPAFEHAMAAGTDASVRRRAVMLLYDVFTLFQAEVERR